ncbi:hypothetical protein KEU06_24085 [Pseudaminobacter sp. 19-2017]|uniref:Uncharacterized protein n=1 Tax=Pseudaminobacter soli (ex Zhang et al. 2022) TaxID=2831468 RepID=A0A942E235_9HYPH|nr:hypothetical protein [Pseudaminobacter soli]MBS3651703.1 hypothetical protein [Pseudaminobacter soli]
MSALPATVPQRLPLFRYVKAKRWPAPSKAKSACTTPPPFLQKHSDVTIVCNRAAAADQRNNPTIEKPHA